MNAKVLIKYWRTILVVAEMTLRQQLTDGFIIFTIRLNPYPSDTFQQLNKRLFRSHHAVLGGHDCLRITDYKPTSGH